jgi:hypothetical protein
MSNSCDDPRSTPFGRQQEAEQTAILDTSSLVDHFGASFITDSTDSLSSIMDSNNNNNNNNNNANTTTTNFSLARNEQGRVLLHPKCTQQRTRKLSTGSCPETDLHPMAVLTDDDTNNTTGSSSYPTMGHGCPLPDISLFACGSGTTGSAGCGPTSNNDEYEYGATAMSAACATELLDRVQDWKNELLVHAFGPTAAVTTTRTKTIPKNDGSGTPQGSGAEQQSSTADTTSSCYYTNKDAHMAFERMATMLSDNNVLPPIHTWCDHRGSGAATANNTEENRHHSDHT